MFRLYEAAVRDLRQPAMNRHPRAPTATLATTGDEAEPLLPAGSRRTPEMPAREFIGCDK